MAKRQLTQPRREWREIDFSLAIVDIVLLLVFFFLITGTLVESDELAVDLAKTEELPLDRLPRPLLVMLPGEVFVLDGDEVDRNALNVALETSFEEGSERVLHLLPDRGLPASELLRLMNDPAFADVTLKLVTLRIGGAP